jgi:Fur family ferric uptake transcriptional regulator
MFAGGSMSCEIEFPSLFRSQGRRLTSQRTAVLAALRHAQGHRTAEELFEAVAARDTRAAGISLSTVYRTLDALEDMHLVSKLAAGASATYEWVGDEPAHHHLVCDACGRVTALELESVSLLTNEIRERSGFEPVIHHLGIGGLCADCAAGGAGAHSTDATGRSSHLARTASTP